MGENEQTAHAGKRHAEETGMTTATGKVNLYHDDELGRLLGLILRERHDGRKRA